MAPRSSRVRIAWGLECIVSKKAAAPYRSGPKCDWIKVKVPSWREANQGEMAIV